KAAGSDGSTCAIVPSQVVDALRPIVLQQPRKGPVGKELSARLAARAVVGLILGIDDPLNRRIAHRTGLAVAPMHRHSLPESRDLLGKPLAGFGPKDVGPAPQCHARPIVEPPF